MGPRPTRPKNWRCSGCGFTGNHPHWTWCGGTKCNGEWRPEEATGAGKLTAKDLANDAAKSSADHELDDTRAHLVALVAALPPGHATIDEYTAKVAKLEAEQVTHVSTADRLRALLADSTKMKKLKESTETALNSAVKTLESASAAVQTRMQACELATASFNANTLEIAELTRPVRTDAPPEGTMVQALRAQLDDIPAEKLLEQGVSGPKLTEFFLIFQSLMTALDVAKAPDLPTPTPTPVTATPTPTPVTAATLPPVPAPVIMLVVPDGTAVATVAPVAASTAPAGSAPAPTPTGRLADVDTDITPGQESQADKRLREGAADPHGDAEMDDEETQLRKKAEPLAAAATALKKAKVASASASLTSAEAEASDL